MHLCSQRKAFLLLITLLSLLMQAGYAQQSVTKKTASEKVLKWYEKGLEESRNGNTDKALDWFEKCLIAEPTFLEALLQYGGILYDRNQLDEAELRFEEVVKLDADYFPRVWYTLGVIAWRKKEFSEAAIRFDNYIHLEKRNATLLEKAQKYLSDSRFSEKALHNPVPFEPVPLGEGVNSQMPEYLPTLTAEGNLLIFTRVVGGQEDFYESKREGEIWQNARPITTLNTPLNEGAQSISADGKMLAFTGCNRNDGYGSCDIYLSERKEGRWQPARNIGPPVSSGNWESQPSLSANGQALYFASNRSGGIGGKDIWVTYRTADGDWSEPRNLGPPVNTERDEQSPFIHADGETLYFESEGHPGMGGHDIFVSRQDRFGKWSEPKNLGYPVNTSSNEGAIFVNLSGRTAFFATDRRRNTDLENEVSAFDDPSGGLETDLFRFELPEGVRARAATYLKARVFSSRTRLPVEGAVVDLVDLSNDREIAKLKTDSDGSFLVCLPTGRNYALHVSAEGHLFSSEHFALEDVHSLEEPFIMKIWMEPVPTREKREETSQPVVLRNVFFATGSAELLPASLHELNRLRDLLRERPDLRIQLRGHTDDVGSDEDNLLLSEHRAKAVFDFLVTQGIDPDRLEYRGFGETLPVSSNESPEGRQENRRTEFVILKP